MLKVSIPAFIGYSGLVSDGAIELGRLTRNELISIWEQVSTECFTLVKVKEV